MNTLYAYNDLPRHAPERARVFLEDVRGRCLAAGRADLAGPCDTALMRVRAARDLELSREASRTYDHPPSSASRLDAELDRINGLIWRGLTYAMDAGDLHPLAAAAAEVRAAAYPRGIKGQVQSTFVEKADLHLRAAEHLGGAAATRVVDGLMLRVMVDRLAALALDFDAALRPPPPPVSYPEVRAAIHMANEHVLRAIQTITSAFDPDVAEQVVVREELLQPVRRANEEVRARHAARRARTHPRGSGAGAPGAGEVGRPVLIRSG